MIPFIVICLLALVAWLLVWSVVSFFQIDGLRKQIREMQARLTGQAALLDDLRFLVRRLWSKSEPPSARVPAPASVAAPGDKRPEAAPTPPTAIPAEPVSRPVTSIIPPASPPVLPQTAPKAPSHVGINWEMFFGVKLFAWIGGLALFLGVAYFVKYSFDNNLVPPALRMALGYLAGAGLLAGGVAISRRPYRVTAETLCATGVVILYAVTYASHAVYHFAFFSLLPTFLIMALVTIVAFAVAVVFETQVVALLGMLGGFLTPVLLSTGVDHPLGLFGYIAVLDVGLLAVALRRRWLYLGALAALGTILTEAGWVAEFFTPAKVQVGVTIFMGFSLLFSIGLLWGSLPSRLQRSGRGWLAGAAVAVAFAAIAFSFVLLAYPTVAARPWFFLGLAFGADLCLLVDASVRPTGLVRIHLASGGLVFLLLASWLVGYAPNALLPWVLAACLAFAALHTLFPLLLQRFRPDTTPAWWAHLFSPAALLLVLLTIIRLPEVSWLVWPLVFAVDLLAIGVALFSGALFAIVFALMTTIAVTTAWLLCVPPALADVSTALILISGFGVLFFAASAGSIRRVGRAAANPDLPAWLTGRTGAEYLAAMSAGLPFLLLILVVLRLPLTSPTPVFAVAALFVGFFAALSWMLTNGSLPAVALTCTALLEYTWLGSRFTAANAAGTVAWNLGFFLMFAGFPFVCRKRFTDRLAPWVAAALAAPIHFHLVYEAVRRAWPNGHMGLIPAAFVLPAAASLVIAQRIFPFGTPRRLAILAWFGGVMLFFVTLIFPIQFERQWITLGWAFEGAALLWLYHRLPHPGLRLTGVGLLIAAFIRLALNPAVLTYHLHTATPLLNWYLYAYGLTTLSLIAGARLLAPLRNRVLGLNAPAVLYSLAGVLAFLLLNLEIADYFTGTGQILTFQFSGNFARDMTYTIAWALFAFGLIVLGIARRAAGVRRAAIGLLGITVLKLFLHDLAHLDQLYRIAALVAVAAVAILASFLYQRFLPHRPKS